MIHVKRREFLRRTMLGAAAVALPVALSTKSGLSILMYATSGTPPPELTSQMIKDMVAVMKDREIQPFDEDYYMITHPEQGFAKLLHEPNVGFYEGVRFIEQTQIPLGAKARTHSYLDLARGRWG